jgi:hypothetical protein
MLPAAAIAICQSASRFTVARFRIEDLSNELGDKLWRQIF